MSERVPAGSKVTLWAHVRAREAGQEVDPTSFPVELAWTGLNADPLDTDWKTASWELDGTRYKARAVVGPGGGVITLMKGKVYKMWVRVTTPSEKPILPAGKVIVE